MNTNLIDQQIIDSFFKYYKKDVNVIQEDEFRILKEKISENAVEISNNISKTNVSYINKSSKTEVTVTKNEISRDMQN